MTLPNLVTFPVVAKSLGVPVDSLRKVADEHGMTIRIGRALRLMEGDISELIELCRVKEKAPASIGGREKMDHQPGKFATAAPASRPAQATVAELRKNLRDTSKGNTAPAARVQRRT